MTPLDDTTLPTATCGPDAILTIAIDTRQPLGLDDFASGLVAWQADYARFYSQQHPEHAEDETRLVVKDVRTGSIIVDVAPLLAPLVGELAQLKTVIDYVDAVRTKVLPWFKEGGRNPDATRADLNGFHTALAGIARDTSGSLALKARYVQKNGKGEEVRSEFTILSEQARTVRSNIEAEQIERQAPGQETFQQVVMYLHQASLDEARAGRAAGEKGIIETISDRPLKLVYASDLAGQRIKSELREDGNPLKKAFVVDVNVETVRGAPHAYRITHVHSVEPTE